MTQVQTQADAGATPSDETQNNQNDQAGQGAKIIDELMYCFASFHAIVAPVAITMILSALAVVFINTEETRAAGEAAYSQTYEVLDLEEGNSSQNLGASVANTLIIVSVICVMTFVVVLCYKYRCMKIFLAYMIFVTAMLLGYFTSNMCLVAIEKYGWKIDKLSFAYVIWNYAIVGVLALFNPKGIPLWVSQGYLIGSSVVLAWQLSYFNEWTAWTLLVVLALYDLFAVLTPCGPLKALANLMSKPGAEQLPGLLYEAPLPTNVRRPNRRGGEAVGQEEGGSNDRAESQIEPNDSQTANRRERLSEETGGERLPEEGSSLLQMRERLPDDEAIGSSSLHLAAQPNISSRTERNETHQGSVSPVFLHSDNSRFNNTDESDVSLPSSPESIETALPSGAPPNHSAVQVELEPDIESLPKGLVPLAIAKMYKLQVIDTDGRLKQRGDRDYTAPRTYQADEIRAIEWTPKQLGTEVTVVFSSRGGRIEKSEEQTFEEGSQYVVYSRSGELLRTFVVNRQGKVLQVVKRERTNAEESQDNSIKLGLGDFIFYSVLVSKAALYSFVSFASCMLVILTGLGGTLVLLAVHGKALPALPISIFLGVIVFVLSIYFLEPFIQFTFQGPLYF